MAKNKRPLEDLSFEELLDVVKLNKRYLGFSGMANFGENVSSSRYAMFFGFFGQYVSTLKNSEPPITLSGLEHDFGETLFSRRLPHDSTILSIIDRYYSPYKDGINTVCEKIVIYHDRETNQIDFMNIPYIEKHNPKFGFNHKPEPILDDVEYGDTLEAGTYLSRTNSDKGDGEVGFGLNVTGALISHKHVAEDTVIITESLSKRGEFTTYQTIEGMTGYNNIPLNAFGDDENYKVFPDLGEIIDDTVVFATRSLPPSTFKSDGTDSKIGSAGHYISTYSNAHLQCLDPEFDRLYNVNKPKGKVVDIIVLKNPKGKKVASHHDAFGQLEKYANAYKAYAKQFVETIDKIKRDYKGIPLSHKLHNEAVYFRSILDESIVKTKGLDKLDLYYVKIVVEFTHTLKKGMKVTGLYGNKGVIGGVVPDEYLNGLDYIMEAKSIAGRMNPGVIFNGTIGYLQKTLGERFKEKCLRENIDLFNISKFKKKHKNFFLKEYEFLIDLIKLLELQDYQIWKNATYEEKIEVLQEIIHKGFRFIVPMDSKIPKDEMIERIRNSVYFIPPKPLRYNIRGKWETTESPIEVITTYMLVLSKIGDSWLATNSAHVNHFGVPTSNSKAERTRFPFSPNPVKHGEAESRLSHAYVGPEGFADLRNRSVNIYTHKRICGKIVTAEDPFDIKRINPGPYKDDKPLTVMEEIIGIGGVEIAHKEDLEDILD